MHHRAKATFRRRIRGRVVALSRASLAMPLYATVTKNFASKCDPKAGCGAGCRQSARFPSRSGFTCQEGTFPLAEHSSASQSSRLHIVVEGVSH
jgi:hypothetical protein